MKTHWDSQAIKSEKFHKNQLATSLVSFIYTNARQQI